MTIRDAIAAHHAANEPPQPTKIITVRLSKALHERLKDTAHRERTSLNVLCLLALEQVALELESQKQEAP